MITVTENQVQFYQRWLMTRSSFQPAEFGIEMKREEFIDLMVDDFSTIYRGQWTIDELLLHPREAAMFCDDIRRKHGFFDLPDDIILRSILNRRKNPSA